MSDWNTQANTIFLRAFEIADESKRQSFIDQECRNDEALRRDVESLLLASCKVNTFLESPLHPRLVESLSTHGSNLVGRTIGGYKLLEQIGEGGFALVYMAEQNEPISRKVAIKLLKSVVSNKEVLARFESERQAIAMMNHPNIAKIFDAGTTEEGWPFFVMELVNGMPLIEFCNEFELEVTDRLRLFESICRGVQHAHQKGIIHRDLKPSNILVTLHGEEPIPMIIDFGIAKSLGDRLTKQTLFTRFGQMVGTPQYMSPEQSGISALDVDTRSDIYSLGVILYELLTDTTPLEIERICEAGVGEMLRLMEEDDPPTPSQRLSRLGPRSVEVCKKRNSSQIQLARMIRGNLDWIVMKAIDKTRDRRYASAGNLANDISRHLRDEEIEARPPSAAYRMARFAKRNRRWISVAFLFAMGLIAGLIGTTWAWKQVSERLESERNQYAYESTIADAAFHWEEGRQFQVRQLLKKCPVEKRGWEWQLLDTATRLPSYTKVAANGFSADDRSTIGLDNIFSGHAIVETDITTGRTKNIYAVDGSKLTHGVISNDSTLFACFEHRSNQTALILVELESGSKLWERAISEQYDDVAINADNTRVAVALTSGGVLLFDAENGTPLGTLPSAYRGCVAMTPDGKVVSQGPYVWEADTGVLLHYLDSDENELNVNAISHDGKLLARGSVPGTISIWDVATGTKLRDLHGHKGWIAGLEFSPDDSRIASGSVDTTVRLWDTSTGVQYATLGYHDETAYGSHFSHDGTKLISSSSQYDYRLWDISVPNEFIVDHRAPLCGATPIADEETIVTLAEYGSLKYWDTQTGQLINRKDLSVGQLSYERAYLPNRNWIAIREGINDFVVIDLKQGSLIHRATGPNKAFAFTPNGRFLLSGNEQGMTIWDTTTWQPVEIISDARLYDFNQIAVSPCGRFVAAHGKKQANKESAAIHVWEIANRKLVALLPEKSHSHALEFLSAATPLAKHVSSDLILVSGSKESRIHVWDVRSETLLDEIEGRSGWNNDFFYSESAKRLFSINPRGIGVWDLASGSQLLTIQTNKRFFDAALIPSSRALLTWSADGTAKIWELTPPSVELKDQRIQISNTKRIVDSLYDELFFTNRVLNQIKSTTAFDERFRRAAASYAALRGDQGRSFCRKLRKELATGVLLAEEVEHRMRIVAGIVKRNPESALYANTLAMIQYHQGDYAATIETLGNLPQVTARSTPPFEDEITLLYRFMANSRLKPNIATETQYSEMAASADDLILRSKLPELRLIRLQIREMERESIRK